METIQALVPIMLAVSLFLIVMAIGMDATIDDVLHLWRRPKDLLKAIVAVNLVVPIAAVLITALFPLPPVVKAGIILMAVSPAPPMVPRNELKVGGSKSYSYGLFVALIILAIVIVPATIEILSWYYGVAVSIPVWSVARYVLLTVLLPLAVGMAIRRFLPALAQRASGPANAIGMVLLLVALVPILIAVGPRIVPLMGNGTLVASALVAVAALIGGHLLGGPDPRNRAALAMASAMRHPGIAMMIAGANIPDRRVQAAILGFLLAGIVAAAPYQMWCKRHPHPAIAE